jgi:P-type conjugative transfer protein TrbJ
LTAITASVLTVALPFTALATGIPVFDASNLGQNVISALNSVRHTLQQAAAYAQQVEQYRTQLLQYVNEIKQATGLAEAARVWAEAQDTMRQLQSVYQAYQSLTSTSGLQQYLAQFRDVNYYLNTPSVYYQPNYTGPQMQKQANDAFVRGIVLQEDALKQDAATVERMRASAQGVNGQLQALEAANQFAQMQNTQLIQIRAILLQQQQALAAQMQTQADDAARQKAALEQYYRPTYQPAQRIGYRP